MITGLRGRVNSLGASRIHLEVAGVEYELHAPLNVIEGLQHRVGGEEIFLHIHHHFLQDEQRLYAFLDRNQRDFFSALQAIKGIGSSLSLSILSHLSGEALLALCEKKDVATLCKIPKVGKTTSETLVFEINRKIDRWRKLVSPREGGAPDTQEEGHSSTLETVFQGLLQLGYRENQIRSVLEKISKESAGAGAQFTFSEWMTLALKKL